MYMYMHMYIYIYTYIYIHIHIYPHYIHMFTFMAAHFLGPVVKLQDAGVLSSGCLFLLYNFSCYSFICVVC